MGDWPSWRLTASQRKKALNESVTVDDLLEHYADLYSAKMIWKGTPEDMPDGFITKAVFWVGAVAPIRVFGENHISAVRPVLYGIYHQALDWQPVPPPGTALPPDAMQTHDAKKYPVLLFENPLSEEIRPLCKIMAKTYKCLEQTVQAMRQPVVLQGNVGGEINAVKTSEALSDLEIFSLDRAAMSAGVIDLGGHDHTQNLISTINALDCEILARLGFKSAGTEKASGVTVEETVSVTQELDLRNRREIRLCEQWVEKVRDFFPGLSVELSPEVALYDEYTDKEPSVPGREEPGDPDGGDGPSPAGDKGTGRGARGGRKKTVAKDGGPDGRRRSDGE